MAGDPNIADAINALTMFLRNGSAARDPGAFSKPQLQTERQFADLVAALGRAPDIPARMVDPVLSNGQLTLGAALPPEVTTVAGYTRRRQKQWAVPVANAVAATKDPLLLKHKDFSTKDVVRLRGLDATGAPVLVGFPEIDDGPGHPRRRP